MTTARDVAVRAADQGEVAAVLSVLDGAGLATDLAGLRAAVRRGDVLVATRDSAAGEATLVGALVVRRVETSTGRSGQRVDEVTSSAGEFASSGNANDSGADVITSSTDEFASSGNANDSGADVIPSSADEITNVAVRPRNRGQGIGTHLVERALADHGRLVVAFEPSVGPFWEALDVETLERLPDGRRSGLLER